MSEPRYALNRSKGTDTIHRNPMEHCNVDDATDREWIDQATASALLTNGSARACGHCHPQEEPS